MPFNMTDLIQSEHDDEQINANFSLDILKGLSEFPKRVPSKYFYDDQGSEYFKKIMESEDYYLTNLEQEILDRYSSELPNFFGEKNINIVDLGAGDGSKSMTLIKAFQKKDICTDYYPIDISKGALLSLQKNLDAISSETQVNGIVADYFTGIKWLANQNKNRNLVLFLGSNLGNFSEKESRDFLHHLWEALNQGDFLYLGFDLKKKISILNKAYNDKEGYTRAFNLNLLKRINRELGANFDVDQFNHYGSYDPDRGAMVSYLISQKKQDVFIESVQKNFSFKSFEPIHVEFSYKYLPEEIESIAEGTGYSVQKFFFDSKKWFGNVLLKVEKDSK